MRVSVTYINNINTRDCKISRNFFLQTPTATYCSLSKKSYSADKEREEKEEEDTPAFRLPCSVECCPRTVSRGPMLFLHLLVNVAVNRRPA